jgi:hypothetical protein
MGSLQKLPLAMGSFKGSFCKLPIAWVVLLILVSPVSHYHAGLIAVGRAGVAVCDRYLTRARRASPQLPSITIPQTIGKPTG